MIILYILLVIFSLFVITALFGAPYVPSKKRNLKKLFTNLYPIKKDDVVIDIGSGGGVVLRLASQMGAKKAVGYEINPVLVLISRFICRKYKNVQVMTKNHWLSDLPPDTTVVYVFSVDRDINKIDRWMQGQSNRLQKPIYLISLAFKIDNKRPIRKSGLYFLYHFNPLQPGEAQV